MFRLAIVGIVASGVSLIGGLGRDRIPLGRAFPSADAAAQALISAAEADDVKALVDILGAGAEAFFSIHPDANRRINRDFAAQASQKVKLVAHPQQPDEVILLTGEREWPLPIPIVAIKGKWYFDTDRIVHRRKFKASR